MFHLRVWNPGDGEMTEVPLRVSEPGASETIGLRCLPGASGIYVVLSDAHGVRLRAEVFANPGETVPLRIELDDDGAPHVSSRARNVLLFRVEDRHDPVPLIQPAASSAPLDVAIVVDGTIRNWLAKEGASSRLLDDKDSWPAHVEKLIDFTARMAAHRDTHVAVLAFGDQDLPGVTAADLQPQYHLHPAEGERMLLAFDEESVREMLLAIPSTPGGDLVDALADALDACVHLRWRDHARKLVVVSGDSPGASLLHLLPKGADFCVRRLDVDTQVVELHRLGVEVVTIYHAPPSQLVLDKLAGNRELLRGVREQYRRLASLPDLAFEVTMFDAAIAANRVTAIERPIARGAAWGELVAAPDAKESKTRTATAGKTSGLHGSVLER
jgi:hypothetical protein